MGDPSVQLVAPVALLRPVPKHGNTGQASVRPVTTVRRVWPRLRGLGCFRVEELVAPEWSGVSVASVIWRCEATASDTYAYGRGTTPAEARAGALMEAVERFSAAFPHVSIWRGSHSSLAARGRAIHPETIVAPRCREYDERREIEWVEGHDLLQDEPTYVPLGAVAFPYAPPAVFRLHASSTNGLAAGNTIEEAIRSALCEVIERDAVAMYRAFTSLRPRLDRLRSQIGIPVPPVSLPADGGFPCLSLRSLPSRVIRRVAALRSAGCAVTLRDVTGPIRVATLECCLTVPGEPGYRATYTGYATHPDARAAAMQSLSEAVQVCVVDRRNAVAGTISGQRGGSAAPAEALSELDTLPLPSVPTFESRCVRRDIVFLLSRLREAGLSHAVAVPLTHPRLGIPVVRVVVPGAETWTLFAAHTRRAQLGHRLLCGLGASVPLMACHSRAAAQ